MELLKIIWNGDILSNYISSFANGAAVDAELTKVANSNLSATHKITRSATIVVAASDSSAKSKAQADYVCDGTADNVQIQAAIDSIVGSGGEILLLEGNFVLDDDVDVYGKISISGMGQKTTVISCAAMKNGFTVDAQSHNGVNISNMSFDLHNTSYYGIRADKLSDAVLSNIYFEDVKSGYHGVYIGEFYRVRLDHLYSIGDGGVLYCLNNAEWNVGDSVWTDVQSSLTGISGDDVGIYISGGQSSGIGAVNDIVLINPVVSATGEHPNTKTGIHIVNGNRINMIHPNIQGPDTAIKISGYVGGVNAASNNSISMPYFYNVSNDVVFSGAVYGTECSGGGSTDGAGWTGLNGNTVNLWRAPRINDSMLTTHQGILSTFGTRVFEDDFYGSALDSKWVSAGGTVGLSGTGGIAMLQTGDVPETACKIESACAVCTRRSGFIFEALVYYNSSSNIATRIGLSNGMYGTIGNGIYFEKLAADANWYLVSCDGSSQTRVDTGVVYSSTSKVFALRTNTSDSTVTALIDGQKVCSVASTLPTSNVGLSPSFYVYNVSPARIMYIDYLKMIAGRYL